MTESEINTERINENGELILDFSTQNRLIKKKTVFLQYSKTTP